MNKVAVKWSGRPNRSGIVAWDTSDKAVSNTAVKGAGIYPSKEQRAQDARQAVHEYESGMRAAQKKTERLRALRLAKAAVTIPSELRSN